MSKKRIVTGDRPPAFPCKSKLAAELCLSESTVDVYVKRGLLPKPIKLDGSIRWIWRDVEESMHALKAGGDDPYIAGLKNV